MNRIIPVIVIVALLVLGGIWLSTQKTSTAIQAQNPQVKQGTVTSAGATQTEERSSEEIATQKNPKAEEVNQTEAATEGINTAVAPEDLAIPEGYSLTPFLSDSQQQNFEQAEQVLEAGKDYEAIVVTNKGILRIDLFESEVPNTVNNFVFLARNHYYDGIIFHRVLDGFMAQTGDPTGTGSGGPGYEFDDEIVDSLKHDKRGILSMANAGPGTNGSQFFITFDATPWLDGKHTIFGRLLEGDEVLSKLQLIDPSQPGNPNVIAMLDETLVELKAKGVKLAGEEGATVGDYLTSQLTGLPEVGKTFEIDGFKGISGRMGETPAVGFYMPADVMQHVYIIEKTIN